MSVQGNGPGGHSPDVIASDTETKSICEVTLSAAFSHAFAQVKILALFGKDYRDCF